MPEDDPNIEEKESSSSRNFVNISDISTYKREEMACPKCWTKGLEAHPIRAEEYDGVAALFRGTICPNENCENHSGVPESTIRKQYEKPSLMEKLTGKVPYYGPGEAPDEQEEPEDEGPGLVMQMLQKLGIFRDRKVQILVVGLIIIVAMSYILPVVFGFIGGFLEGGDGNPNGSPANNTSTNGTADLVNNTTVDSDDTIKLNSSDINTSEGSNGSGGSGSSGNLLVNISPISTGSNSDNVQVEGSKTINIPSSVTSSSLTLSPKSNLQNSYSNTYTVTNKEFSFSIDEDVPEQATITLSGLSNSSSETVENSISRTVSGSTTIQQDFGNIQGEATIRVLNGEESSNSVSGTWSGTDPTIDLSSSSQVNITLEGISSSSEETKQGKIEGSSISESFETQVEDATIEFLGGESQSSSISTTQLSRTYNSAGRDDELLYSAESDTTVSLDINYEEIENPDLVTAGYSVNGIDRTVSTGYSNEEVTLSEGDTLGLWIETEKEGGYTESKNYNKPSEQPSVTDTSVSDTQIQPGESITVSATLRNDGSEPYNTPIELFKDGSKVSETTEVIEDNSEQTVTAGSVSFDQEGIHTVSVNEGEQIEITVGSGEIKYGKGEIEASGSTQSNSEGTVKVDTNSNGTYDCETASNGGSCSLGDLEEGFNSISVEESGTTNTEYELKYTQITNSKNIKVDYNNDGNYEIQNSSLAEGETLTENVELNEGPQTIDIEADGQVKYNINSESTTKGVKNLNIQANNNQLTQQSFVSTPSEFKTSLNQGENTINIEGEGSYDIEIEWSETETKQTQKPSIIVNGQNECTNQQTCIINNLQKENTIKFEGENIPSETSVEYTIEDSIENTNVQVNDESIEYTPSDIRTRETKEINLKQGENTININNSKVNGEIVYSYTNSKVLRPKLIIKTDNNEMTRNVPENILENGFLTEKYTFKISKESLGNTNRFKVTTENGNPVRIQISSE